ncbi:putative N-acetyltransferase 16 [Mixophyes fleayi]|uniref:putative N-acetyltransferase 16 n=1 Tax=Mixophyes fleayi TaxID=3061075 RepID=UPI003F4DFB53
MNFTHLYILISVLSCNTHRTHIFSMSTQIHFLPATAEDYDEVMSISGGIYNGADYLPHRYHAWLKDPCRRMFLAKSEGKVVGFESFLLVDGGVTAVVEGLRVAPWLRGLGVAGLIQKFCMDTLRSDHPEVKSVCLTRVEDPPPAMLQKYRVINSKVVISVLLPSHQLEEVLKLLECRVDNLESSKTHSVLGPTEMLKLFEGAKIGEELVPGGRLIQSWLPLTTHKANLELLLERRIVSIYSNPCYMSDFLAPSSDGTISDTNRCQPSNDHNAITASPITPLPYSTSSTQSPDISALPLSSKNSSSPGFLSLGTPPYPVPFAKGAHRFDIDMFGNDPVYAKIHVLQHLKIGIQALPAAGDIICFMYAEESLRTELNQLCEGLTPFHLMREQIVLEMDI